jgi:hypothetical protein
MPQVIALCGWEKYQHYKDRDPPWVKLYRDLLTTESWVLGTDASRLVQVASILLAARYQNATPLNFALIKKVASLDISEREFNAAIEHLSKYEFLEIQGDNEPCKQPASKPLATCTSETEQSREETEERQRQRATRNCPDWFVVTPEMRTWASSETPNVDVDRETATFKDYTFATPRSDWVKTWRNWMRKAKPLNGARPTRYEENRQRLAAWKPEETTNPLLLERKP